MERNSSGEPEVALVRPPRRRTVLLTGNCVSLHRPAGTFGRVAALAGGGGWPDEGHGDRSGCPAPQGAARALCEHLLRTREVGHPGLDFGPDELTGGAYLAVGGPGGLALGTCPAFVSDFAADLDTPCIVVSPAEIRTALAEMREPLWLAMAPEREHGRGLRPWLVAEDYTVALDFLADTAGLCGSLRLTSAKGLLDATARSGSGKKAPRMPMPRRGGPR